MPNFKQWIKEKCQRIYRGKHMPLPFNKKPISNWHSGGKAVEKKK